MNGNNQFCLTMSTPPSKSQSGESKPLLDSATATSAAVTGAGILNASAQHIRDARADGPLTFRVLGFLGGIAMVISNALAITERFFGFNWGRCIIAIYGVFFGLVIFLMDAPLPVMCSARLQNSIRYYFKFLEFTLGRGVFFFFVGSLQITNFNMLDWAVGGYMMFVGFVAVGGESTTRARKNISCRVMLLTPNLSSFLSFPSQWVLRHLDRCGYCVFLSKTSNN